MHKTNSDFSDLKLAISNVQQPRSNFELDNFVLGQHATPEMQYYQTCIELQDSIFKYENAKLGIEITQLKISKLLTKNNEISTLKAKKLELGLEQTRMAMVGAEREIAYLFHIWSQFETKYTREQIESGQQEYWKQRLTNNARAMLSGGSGINPAHLEAMQQAGILDNFVKEIELERKELNL
jgi:hypothetical protein